MEDKLLWVLRTVAPGTPLRDGLESILKAKTGALILVGDEPEILEIVEGGFTVNAPFTPANLYELAKMDGAIVLAKDLKQILFANTQLVPNLSIPSSETGIRHRTAERVAKQTDSLVVSISQRRNVITVYKGNIKYVLRDLGVILTKANQAIQTLEKYRNVLDKVLVELSILEIEESVSLFDVARSIQRVEMVLRVVKEIERYISELGVEGRLITMQMEELVANVEEEGLLVIRDYAVIMEDKTPRDIMEVVNTWPSEDLLELPLITKALGFPSTSSILEQPVYPKGYRVLDKIPRLPFLVIENLIKQFGSLKNILNASIQELDAVEGIGEVRARSIKDGLSRYREQLRQERYTW